MALREAIEKIEQQMSCRHQSCRGGNDYVHCDECGFEWDYRRKGGELRSHLGAIQNALSEDADDKRTVDELTQDRHV